VKLHPRDNPAFLLPRRVGRKRAAPRGPKTPEAEIQDLTEQYLRLLGLPYLHLPAYLLNASFGRHQAAAGPVLHAMRAAAESIRGVPDLIIFSGGRYLALELKSRDGKLTAAQEQWLAWLGGRVCRSFEEAREVIDEWRK
jgi:hypothetical protein